MVRITEELIRKRAEHNELMISTLEELSLHQLDIERIEHLDRWCRNLKILYLQYNLIPRIEHVSRLKELDYLNLALNNIERIEGLDGCEKLRKLDLTANFIGAISSIELLRANEALRELYLTGNPCTGFEGYRAYVVAALPQLHTLDGEVITPSERLCALQQYETKTFRDSLSRQEREHELTRSEQKRDHQQRQQFACRDTENSAKNAHQTCSVTEIMDDEDDFGTQTETAITEADVWAEKESFTPESRLATYKTLERIRGEKEKTDKSRKTLTAEADELCGGSKTTKRSYFNDKTGAALNVNEAKLNFRLEDKDDESNCFVLHVPVYRHMDSSLVQAEVQPDYVRVTIKDKVLQLVLPENVRPSESKAHRSITGELRVTMPKARAGLGRARVVGNSTAAEQKLTNAAHQMSEANTNAAPNTAADVSLLDLENVHGQKPVTLVAKLKGILADRTSTQPYNSQNKVTEMNDCVKSDAHSLVIKSCDSVDSNCDDFVDDDSVPPLEAAY